MDKELEKLKEIFLSTDLDSEDYEDNLKRINEWEAQLRKNEDFESWQQSDITKSIIEQAKKSYKDNSMRLIKDRNLSEAERSSIWAQQDAMTFLLSLVEKDATEALGQIHREIRQALDATK